VGDTPTSPNNPGQAVYRERVEAQLKRIAPQLSRIRRHVHQNPEVSGQEFATTAYISKLLSGAQVPHQVAPGNRGIVTAIAKASDPTAPVVALRADIDALPIQEMNQTPYRSRKAGVMHACGHDAHFAILLGTTLALHRAGIPPTGWRSIFQPSEESGRGAREIVEFGALEGVQAIVALHVDPQTPVGRVGITPGPRTALCQDFSIQVRGRGGHGARPHLTVDPIATAAQLITLIYQDIPRQTDSRDPVVVSIGLISGGHSANVIPDTVALKGTIRSLSQAVGAQARQTLERVCAGLAGVSGAEILARFDPMLNGVTNDPRISTFCLSVARELLGTDQVSTDDRPSMGSEDFADYLSVVPGCMISLGVRPTGGKVTPLHTNTFDIDEAALLLGAHLLTRVVVQWPWSLAAAAGPIRHTDDEFKSHDG
jgi:amidohydrolase